ncbi:hypothetical protein JCM3775_003187 [Rhodotorula graminis]|uniref:F-box domain-containing protein n=1 Tax=Rhodotorula graminis (strain WP1) TaxID=578459 RepID=A0A194SCQ5_RHOGW|nr:uncharacterized protein RHOBADRAFT_52120 [Rhodotorula graminis WP1]KPV77176.1 hypothetical protein RHOBADRAFT_52120 [Rhodotorula graminis WP1]
MAPSLNLDCIAEVLRQETLTDGDLASACLVSRAVFRLANSLLYHDLALCFSDSGDYTDDGRLLCAIEVRESEKAEAFVDHPRLRPLLRRVEVAFDSLERDRYVRYDQPEYLINDIVKVCPNIDDLGADEGAWFPDMAHAVVEHGRRLRTIRGLKLCDGSWEMLAKQPMLKHLGISRLEHDPSNRDVPKPPEVELPFALEHLAVEGAPARLDPAILEPIFASSAHTIRTLELEFNAATPPDLSRFTALRSLHLCVDCKRKADGTVNGRDNPDRVAASVIDALRPISHLPLRSLAITHDDGHTRLEPLFRHPSFPSVVPSTVTKLTIKAALEIADLERFFGACSAPITRLGHGTAENRDSASGVEQWLAQRGIKGETAIGELRLGLSLRIGRAVDGLMRSMGLKQRTRS